MLYILFLGGPDGEIYRNRKSYFSINTQVVAGADLKILDIVGRWPGSTHDSTIFNASQLRARFEGGQFQNAVLLGEYSEKKLFTNNCLMLTSYLQVKNNSNDNFF